MNVILLTFIVAWNVIQAVRIKELRVPLGASHEAPLDCKYDMENDQLYSVKWYKDGQEFFRCLPNGEVHEFPVEGVKLYHSGMANFGSCPLTLTALTSKSAGEYKCEVSSEGPSFAIVVASRNLRIITSARRIQNDSSNSGNQIPNASTASHNSASPFERNALKVLLLNYYILLFIIILRNHI